MTEATPVLARILGGYMLVMGIGMLIHRRMALDLLERLRSDLPLTYVMAVLALLFGLVIVSIHNVWSGPVAIVISVIGWLAVAEGAAIVVLRQRYMAFVLPLVQPAWAQRAWGAGTVLLGLWLLSASL